MQNIPTKLKELIEENNLTEDDVAAAMSSVDRRWERNFHTEVAMASAFFAGSDLSQEEQNVVSSFVLGDDSNFGACVSMLTHIKRY